MLNYLNFISLSLGPSHVVIQNNQLIESVIEVLRNGQVLRHFGSTYIQLLNTILSVSTDFTAIQCENWKGNSFTI